MDGTFRGRHKGRDGQWLWGVYYQDDRRIWTHALRLDEYGCDGSWVIIEKLPKQLKKTAAKGRKKK